jgi:hypothetical protein
MAITKVTNSAVGPEGWYYNPTTGVYQLVRAVELVDASGNPISSANPVHVNPRALTKADLPGMQYQVGTNVFAPARAISWTRVLHGAEVGANTGVFTVGGTPYTTATPLVIKSPAAGKRVVVLAWDLSCTAAGAYQFQEEGAATDLAQSPIFVAGQRWFNTANLINGFECGAVDADLRLAFSVSGNFTGTVWGCEI